MKNARTVQSIRRILSSALTGNGSGCAVLLISGHHNESGNDRTEELAATIALDYVHLKPLIFPAVGLWEGTEERSLAVVFRDAADAPTLESIAQSLCREFQQSGAILANGGQFSFIGQKDVTAMPLARVLTDFNEGDVLGFTKAFIGKDRQPENEFFRFAIIG